LIAPNSLIDAKAACEQDGVADNADDEAIENKLEK
jgi:hypothetical protein